MSLNDECFLCLKKLPFVDRRPQLCVKCLRIALERWDMRELRYDRGPRST